MSVSGARDRLVRLLEHVAEANISDEALEFAELHTVFVCAVCEHRTDDVSTTVLFINTVRKRSLGQGKCFYTCLSVHRRGLCSWSHVPSWRVSVPGPMFLLGGSPCLVPCSFYWGGGLGGSLFRGVSIKEFSPYCEERVVRILLECILVDINYRVTFTVSGALEAYRTSAIQHHGRVSYV